MDEISHEQASASDSLKKDSGLLALVIMARLHGITAEPQQLRHEFGESGQTFTSEDILLAARSISMKARSVSTQLSRLNFIALPCMAKMKDGRFIIIAKIDKGNILIQDPLAGRPAIISAPDFKAHWSGEIILMTSRACLAGELRKFDFTWFIPAIIKYRRLLLGVLGVSFVL